MRTLTTPSPVVVPGPERGEVSPARTAHRRRERGMTLIEIMVVITILGLIAAAVAVNVVGQLSDAKIKQAKTDLHTIENCLDLYKVDKGRYPSTEEGLQAVVQAGKCKAQMKDPWKHDYVYLYPGQTHPDSFDIKSYGADGQPGGEGENADIVNP
jgi:general secretion pathway protein G